MMKTKYRQKLVIGSILLFMSVLVLIEFVFRAIGFEAGNLTPNWANFKQVDTLIEYHQFKINAEGVVIADKQNFDTAQIQINMDGFRTDEWSEIDTSREVDLFIGDSFTWGLSASPIQNCFVDRIKKSESNKNIINLGIPVADPVQYSFLAQKYVAILKPKQVFVMFFLGNDVLIEDRPLEPFKPIYFYTNAGALLAKDGLKSFATAQEAYDYFLHEKYFILHPKNWVKKIVKQSAVLSLAYSMKDRFAEKMRYEKAIKSMDITKKYLYQVASICNQYQARLYIVVIPERKEADKPQEFFFKKYRALFMDEQLKELVYLPLNNSSSNYVPYPDAHLNNEGHAFYAKEILGLMKKN